MMMTNAGSHESARGYENFPGVARELASESTPAWERPAMATPGAPNVIVVLVDDLGFSDVAPFGGEIDTPNISRVADDGYRLTNFHSTPVCSPARAALLTGVNPHRAGFATAAHRDPGFPGFRFELPKDSPTIAESFRASGYATFMVGKWHLTKEALLHDGADKSSWPVQRGFDRYYGSMDAFTTLYQPHRLVRDNSPVMESPAVDDYLTDGLTDEAIAMIDTLRASDAHKPFFLYFAHQAVHGPLQAKPEDIAKYRNVYDRGWDHIRDERFRRQIALGLFSEETPLPARNQEDGLEVQPWDSLTLEQKALFARYMEVYAAAVDSIDQSLGRIITHLEEIGEYENTIIAFTSDNGGAGEGGGEGTRSYFSQFVFLPGLPADWDRDVDHDLDLVGGPRTMTHYPRGWAAVSNTPFRLYKMHTYGGGIRVPLVISWPGGLRRTEKDDGRRDHFAFVTDLGMTLLDLAGVPPLAERAGLAAQEPDGIPFSATLRDPALPDVREEQYLEYSGHRAFFRDKWKIVTQHSPGTSISDSEWRLYDLSNDPAETADLRAKHPEIVADLARRWNETAWANTVFPLNDDGSIVRNRPDTELALEQPVRIRQGAATVERFRSSRLIQLRSFEIAMEFENDPCEGVLVAHGGQGGGYSIYLENGELRMSYNAYGRMHRTQLPLRRTGRLRATITFTALEGLRWQIGVTVDGDPQGGFDSVVQLVGMAPFTGISVGLDRGSPVDWDYFERHGEGSFTGRIHSVDYLPGARIDNYPIVFRDIDNVAQRVYD